MGPSTSAPTSATSYADMVEKIAKEVDHALEGELDVEEVEGVIGDAKAAADKLRAAGLTEEAAAMDEMVAKLEEARSAHLDFIHLHDDLPGSPGLSPLELLIRDVLVSSQDLVDSLHSGGDGDIAGHCNVFNGEVQRLSRAYKSRPTAVLLTPSNPGDKMLDVDSIDGFRVGDHIMIGDGTDIEGSQITEFL